MDLQTFSASLSQSAPPANLGVLLEAMWWDAKGDWERAHDLVNDLSGQAAARVHAYLHRKEGDAWNANYWYQRAGQRMSDKSLEAEWTEVTEWLLSANTGK